MFIRCNFIGEKINHISDDLSGKSFIFLTTRKTILSLLIDKTFESIYNFDELIISSDLPLMYGS